MLLLFMKNYVLSLIIMKVLVKLKLEFDCYESTCEIEIQLEIEIGIENTT